ncbi:hypothetical protein HMPREF9413_4564 [Paenibacillus sp. HGF7]|nr:hypothetical protein HMPREF9413_4564 [Paenibacillus sp. HGF7]
MYFAVKRALQHGAPPLSGPSQALSYRVFFSLYQERPKTGYGKNPQFRRSLPQNRP